MFDGVYKGKKVLITGHTGFKGSWLSAWLDQLGAKVCGFSYSIPTNPSHYEVLDLKGKILHVNGDVRNRADLQRAFKDFQPDIVFHLAAQPLVRLSYQDPILTFETNVLGTANVLESVRQTPSVQAAVMITSDKCYRNVEWDWGYREDDRLGGKDPYSASKGCAELVIYSYINSFFQGTETRIASARAGNVIGGGDWALDRVVPDSIRAWSQKKPVVLRNSKALRPWQHVLEPLSGYLWLGAQLWQSNPDVIGQAFNFGPGTYVNQSVEELITLMSGFWPGSGFVVDKSGADAQKESMLLKLCCDLALSRLQWKVVLSFEETAEMTTRWYRTFYEKGQAALPDLTYSQINEYGAKAQGSGQPWSRE